MWYQVGRLRDSVVRRDSSGAGIEDRERERTRGETGVGERERTRGETGVGEKERTRGETGVGEWERMRR